MDTMSLPPRPKNVWKSKYFGKELFVLKLFGVSLTGNEGVIYKIYSFIFVGVTVFLYPILDFFEYFKHDVSVVADIIMYQVAGFMALCKMVVVYRNRVSLVNLLEKLEQEPFLANPKRGGKKEQKIIDECVWITNAQTFAYWVTSGITVVGTIIYGYTKRLSSSDYHDWQFPYGPFTFLNVTYSQNYDITYFYQSTSIVFIASVFTSIDLLLASVLAHISYQFKILQNSTRRMVDLSYEEMMKDANEFGVKWSSTGSSNTEIDISQIPWCYLKNSLKEIVKYHLAIADIAEEVDILVSNLLLLVFLGTLALLCFSVYAATAVGHDPQLIVRHVGEGISAGLQVATVCFWGEQVMQESQKVGKAVSELNFVGTDVRFQKMLVLIIRRSQNPTKITAGKFAMICLATFTWIMRTSYSSFMVLRKANT